MTLLIADLNIVAVIVVAIGVATAAFVAVESKVVAAVAVGDLMLVVVIGAAVVAVERLVELVEFVVVVVVVVAVEVEELWACLIENDCLRSAVVVVAEPIDLRTDFDSKWHSRNSLSTLLASFVYYHPTSPNRFS